MSNVLGLQASEGFLREATKKQMQTSQLFRLSDLSGGPTVMAFPALP